MIAAAVLAHAQICLTAWIAAIKAFCQDRAAIFMTVIMTIRSVFARLFKLQSLRRRREVEIRYDALTAFIGAEAFWRGADTILKKMEAISPDNDLMLACSTNQAFALELYLKCLFLLDHRRRPPQTHDHVKLYARLSSKTKHAIQAHFDPTEGQRVLDLWHRQRGRAGQAPRYTIKYALESGRHTFNLMRYLHEVAMRGAQPRKREGASWIGPPVVEAVRQTILSRHSNWRGAKLDGTRPPGSPPPIHRWH